MRPANESKTTQERTNHKEGRFVSRQFTAQDYAGADKYRDEIVALIDRALRGRVLER